MNSDTNKSETVKIATNDEIDLREVWKSIVRKKKIVIFTTSIIFFIGAFNTIKNRIYNPIYTGSFLLLINDPINASTGAGISKAPSSLSFYSNIANSTTNNDVPTLVTFLKSPYLISDLSEKYNLSPKSLSSMIDISQIRTSNKFADGVLRVTLNINDLQKGQELIKDLSNVYLDSALEQKRQRLKDGIKFLDDQAPIMRQKTKKIQENISKFMKDNLIIDPVLEGLNIKTLEGELNNRITILEQGILKITKIKEKVLDGSLSATNFKESISFEGGGIEISSDANASLVMNIALEEEIEIARSKFTEDSNYIRNLKERLRIIRPRLIKSQVSILDKAIFLKQIDLDQTKQQKNILLDIFEKKPDLINKYNSLKEELEISSKNLIALLSAKENFQLEIAQSSVPWKIISPPEMNPSPFKPSIPKGVGYSGIIALGIGVLAGLIRDRLDHVFHDPNEIKDSLGIPFLGNIPYVSFLEKAREKQIKIEDFFEKKDKFNNRDEDKNYERFIWQESIRNIATSLRFLNTDNQIRSFVITSCKPSEGKSSSVILLAKALSDLGLKILLIDSDLRQPQLHYRVGVNNLQGLSNLLTNKNLKFEDLIQQPDVDQSWYIIPAGQKVPDSTRLLSSKRMEIITNQISDSKMFDYIIYDTPPAIGFADASLVASKVDGYILLVSIFNVDRDLPKIVINKMESSKALSLGIISNNQIKSEKIQSTKDLDYRDYSDYYKVDEEFIESDDTSKKESMSLKELSKIVYNNKYMKKILGRINIFLNWIDR